MGQRNARGGRGGGGGRDAGDQLHRDPVTAQVVQLLAAAPEHEGVAALEPHDTLAGARLVAQQGVDLVLAERVIALRLADIDALGVAPGPVQDLRPDQPVVDHHVGALQRGQRLEGQQVRIAGAGADDRHRAGGRFVRTATVDQGEHGFAGSPLVARQHGAGHRAVEDTVPEGPPRAAVGHQGRDGGTEGVGEPGEPAQPRRQQGFDGGAQAARQDRRGAAGGNADHHGVAIDDRRRDEARQLRTVDDVDRHAGGLGGARHFGVDRRHAAGADRQALAVEIAGAEFAALERDPPGLGLVGDLARGPRGDHRHPRAGLAQQAKFPRRGLAAADQQDRAAGQIQEGRIIFHFTPALWRFV